MLHQQTPALIVYAIRVDLSAIKSGRFQYPASFISQVNPCLIDIDDDHDDHDLNKSAPNEGAAHAERINSMEPSPATHTNTTHQLVPILKASNSTGNNNSGKLQRAAMVRPASALPGSCLAGNAATTTSANLVVSETSLRPSSSRCLQGGDSHRIHKADRHVQFKLNQAPRATATGGAVGQWRDQMAALRPQRRQWIEQSVFVSAIDEPMFKLLPLIAALVSYEPTS